MQASTRNHHQDELSQLKNIADQRRACGKRSKHAAEFRQRVLALRDAGVSLSTLQQELGVAASQVHQWAKQALGGAPKVVNIRPQLHEPLKGELGARQPLQLQLGGYRLTIEMVEA